MGNLQKIRHEIWDSILFVETCGLEVVFVEIFTDDADVFPVPKGVSSLITARPSFFEEKNNQTNATASSANSSDQAGVCLV